MIFAFVEELKEIQNKEEEVLLVFLHNIISLSKMHLGILSILQ